MISVRTWRKRVEKVADKLTRKYSYSMMHQWIPDSYDGIESITIWIHGNDSKLLYTNSIHGYVSNEQNEKVFNEIVEFIDNLIKED